MALILTLFFLSGAAALIYQVVWIRSLEFAFGSSTAAVSTVLAAFMGGLALGSAYLGRLSDRLRVSPLYVYCILEVGVVLSALAVPLGIRGASSLYLLNYGVEGPLAIATILRFVLSFALLLIPTVFMGATFPVLAKMATQITPRASWQRMIGWLYGLNTLGAVVGVFLAGFVLLPHIGASRSIFVAILFNVLSALGAFLIARSLPRRRPSSMGTPPSRKRVVKAALQGADLRLGAILAAAFLAGYAALSCEVVWSRLLRLMLAATTYSVCTMLLAFLSGIGVGSLVVGVRKGSSSAAVPYLLIALGLSIAITVPLIFESAAIFRSVMGFVTRGGSPPGWLQILVGRFGLSAAIMFVPAALSGALFPILVSAASQQAAFSGNDASRATRPKGEAVRRAQDRKAERPRAWGTGMSAGAVYATNTVGGVLGSLLTGFVLIPVLGTSATVHIASALMMGLGILLLSRRARSRPWISWAFAGAAVCVFLMTIASPQGGSYLGKLKKSDTNRILYYEEGVGATVIAVEDEPGGRIRLYTNGTFAVDTSFESQQTVALLGHLPCILSPGRHRALVIGMGMGTTLAAVASYPFDEITCVEIVPGVFDAARIFSEFNHGVLEDPRVRKVVEDGRIYLTGSGQTFDVITCDPIHPAFGSPALYTREYYELGRSHLSPQGTMVQYLPLHQLSGPDFRLLLRTFSQVFPQCAAFLAVSHGVLIGSQAPLSMSLPDLEDLFEADIGAHPQSAHIPLGPGELLSRAGVNSPAKLLSCIVLDAEGIATLAGSGPINVDDHSRLEFSENRSFGRNTRIENLKAVLAHKPDRAAMITEPRNAWPDGFRQELTRAILGRAHLIRSSFYFELGNKERALEEMRLADEALPGDREIMALGGAALAYAHLQHGQELYRRWQESRAADALPPGGPADRSDLLLQARASLRRARELQPSLPGLDKAWKQILAHESEL